MAALVRMISARRCLHRPNRSELPDAELTGSWSARTVVVRVTPIGGLLPCLRRTDSLHLGDSWLRVRICPRLRLLVVSGSPRASKSASVVEVHVVQFGVLDGELVGAEPAGGIVKTCGSGVVG